MIAARCTACHAARPTFDGITEAPKGVWNAIAVCGFSGALLGPPNHHDFQRNVARLITRLGLLAIGAIFDDGVGYTTPAALVAVDATTLEPVGYWTASDPGVPYPSVPVIRGRVYAPVRCIMIGKGTSVVGSR